MVKRMPVELKTIQQICHELNECLGDGRSIRYHPSINQNLSELLSRPMDFHEIRKWNIESIVKRLSCSEFGKYYFWFPDFMNEKIKKCKAEEASKLKPKRRPSKKVVRDEKRRAMLNRKFQIDAESSKHEKVDIFELYCRIRDKRQGLSNDCRRQLSCLAGRKRARIHGEESEMEKQTKNPRLVDEKEKIARESKSNPGR
ncbi:hypothetical protein ACOME3_000295 [Neoechinorhynchus agilis]